MTMDMLQTKILLSTCRSAIRIIVC